MGRQLSAGWSAAHGGLGRLSVYRSCRLVAVFVASVCLILKQAHCSRASFVFARSTEQRGFHWQSVCCFRDEQLGWTSLSTNRPTASFLSMCVMDGRVLAQEESVPSRIDFLESPVS